MTTDKIPKQRLNVFLLKAGTNVSDAIAADVPGLISYPIRDGLAFSGLIWIRSPHATPPRWMSFVKAGLATELPLLLNQSVAALIVLSMDGRTFAVGFGSGRHWLADQHIERRFGMKVTLNSVHPDKIRSIDREEFDTITRKTRSQTSASANVESFGLDVQRDLLRSVTGQPEDTSFCQRHDKAKARAITIFEPLLRAVKLLRYWTKGLFNMAADIYAQ